MELELSDEREAETLLKALKPESLSAPSDKRGTVEVHREGARLLVEIYAKDVGSLRALLNSVIYMVYAALESLERSRRGGARGREREENN
ncbi:MAG: KEOPS complex subunit Pcc1 [Fervidicoccaceae archaeon]